MTGTTVQPVQPGRAYVQGAKNSTDLLTVTAAIETAIKNYFDGTARTHPSYRVEVRVIPLGV